MAKGNNEDKPPTGDETLSAEEAEAVLHFDPFDDENEPPGEGPDDPAKQAGQEPAPGAQAPAPGAPATPPGTQQPGAPEPGAPAVVQQPSPGVPVPPGTAAPVVQPGAPAPGQPGQPPAAPGAIPPVAPAQPVVVPGAPPQSPEAQQTELLRQTIASQGNMITELRASLDQLKQPAAVQPQAGVVPGQVPGQQQPQVPAYDFTLPDSLVEATGAEDLPTRKAALATLVKGISQQIHQTVMRDVGQQVPQMVQPLIQSQVDTASANQSVFNEFYGTYPDLSGHRNVVTQAANEVMAMYPQSPWTPQLRDTIAQRTYAIIQQAQQVAPQPALLAGVPAPPVPVQVYPQPGVPPVVAVPGQAALPVVGQPPHQVGGGARPSLAPGNSIDAQVNDLLFIGPG